MRLLFALFISLLLAVTASAAITRKQAVSANAATLTLTSTAANDVIFVFAYETTATAPTVPSGYTTLLSQPGTSQGCSVGWKVSPGGETSIGTWTGANQVVALVYSGTSGPGATGQSAGSSTALTYLLSTALQNTSGSSWVISMGGARSATSLMNGAPTGTAPNLVNQTSVTTANGLDTNAGVTSFSTQTLTVSPTGRWMTFSAELLAGTPVVSKPAFLQFFPQ